MEKRFDLVEDLENLAIYFIENKLNLNSQDESKKTLLMAAVTRKSMRIVDLLVNAGASCDVANKDSETPLFSAARLGHDAIVNILIRAKANMDVVDQNGNTPLKIAIDYGYFSVAKNLLEAGANPNKTNNSGRGPLYSAVKNNFIQVSKSLILKGAKVNTLDVDGDTPLTVGVCYGYFELVKILLNAGAFVNCPNIKARTPIFYAAEKECHKIVEILVEAGADLNFRDAQGHTPLCLAFKSGNLESVEILIEAGADVNAVYQNKTALCHAAKAGFTKMIDTLMFARPISKDDWEYGLPALIQSMFSKSYECTRSLIRHLLLINSEVKEPYFREVELSRYWKACKDEILCLKRITVGCGNLSLLEFLNERNLNKLAWYYKFYMKSENNLIENHQCSGELSIYRYLIPLQVRRAQIRLDLLHQCFQAMNKHWRKLLPQLVLFEIADLLSCKDLKNLSNSVDS